VNVLCFYQFKKGPDWWEGILKRIILLGLLLGTMCTGQDARYDLIDQLALVKNLMPGVKKVGVMLGPADYKKLAGSIGPVQTQLGFMVIPIRLNNVAPKIPQLPRYVSSVAGNVAAQHQLDAILFFHVEDRITKSDIGIQFTARTLKKQKIPVFSANAKAKKLGCLGRLHLKDDTWVMYVNARLARRLHTVIPVGDTNLLQE
jgi:hypothetical protein